MVICLERCVDLHMAQLMPLPLTVSCSNKIQIGFTFLVLAHLGSPGQRAVKRVCVCMCVFVCSGQVFSTGLPSTSSYTHTHTHLMALFSGTTQVSHYQKGKTNLNFSEARDSEGSGISWTICKSTPRSRQITTLAPHHSVFYWPDALPAAQPTASKHWRQIGF